MSIRGGSGASGICSMRNILNPDSEIIQKIKVFSAINGIHMIEKRNQLIVSTKLSIPERS